MAYSDKEIAEAYVQDMCKYIPVQKVRGIVRNTWKAGGKITDRTRNLLLEKKHE